MKTLKKTPLSKVHHDLKARLVDFGGWELPVWFTSILEEHRAVRSRAGMFDVSHMSRIWVTGKKAGALLDKVFTKSARKLKVGGAQLCLMCTEDGGIIDDLWVYRVDAERYLVVWNVGHEAEKLDWLSRCLESDRDIKIEDVSADTAMLAVQGLAVVRLENMKGVSHLPRFGFAETEISGISVFAARTGYTGEDGFELICNATDALPLWESFMKLGVKPCGLGSRDSLRLEAGMMLSGQDMDKSTNPFEAAYGWVVDMENGDFIGKSALLEIKRQGVRRKLIGFQMKGREIARSGYPIFKSGQEAGRVTSGGYAPTLGINIGFGYVPIELAAIGTEIDIIIREKPAPAQIVSKRFYKKGA